MAVGISQPVGVRWFREAGGMAPSHLALSSEPRSGRYLSFAEREEIALGRAQGWGVREVARRLGRAASTISRELRRNAATRSGNLDYRATTAQWHAERAARRPKPAKLATNPALRTYVQDRLAGAIVAPGGVTLPGPVVPWKGRRRGRRQHRRWGMAWSLHPSDALRSIPGIGDRLAPLVLGVLHDQARFGNERQIRGFCGLFPTTSASGGAERPRQRITQAGNDRMKRALFLAADTARHIDPDLAGVYWRLMVRRGHHHKQALCAVATRLVNRINMVLRTGRTYEMRDLEGRAITVAEGRAIVTAQFTIPDEIRRIRRRSAVPIPA